VDALTAMAATTIDLVATAPLLQRMWELRSNVSGYAAAYLALAETFECSLVTADARLALVEDAVATSERVTITRHGRPAAVLISVDDLETMEETLFWQAQHRVHEDIGTARTEAETGQLTDESTVRRRYGIGSTR